MSDSELERRFDEAMLRIYQRALSDTGYKAARFLELLYKHRGLGTARLLLSSPTVSEGYTALWQRGRLDLTVEALIHDHAEWHPLFTSDELTTCRNRLREYAYARLSG